MALLHKAEIRPTKLELLTTWLPAQKWYTGPAEPEVTRIAAARFDDPAGEVGIEIMLVRVGDGPVLHTPLTYRGAPLPGGEEWLAGTTEHSYLGPRWVYDAAGDPVARAVIAAAIRTGAQQAEEELRAPDGTLTTRVPDMKLHGTGGSGASVEIIRFPSDAMANTLTGVWPGQDTPLALARLLP
ncbi:hypothetical protein [Actinoplanes sp. NPDC051851]|uniref:CG0192-related protein n=1 Tax=Actinoplanes sp. NPDC051851 TaxID=3154753 RepID=UPI00342834FE